MVIMVLQMVFVRFARSGRGVMEERKTYVPQTLLLWKKEIQILLHAYVKRDTRLPATVRVKSVFLVNINRNLAMLYALFAVWAHSLLTRGLFQWTRVLHAQTTLGLQRERKHPFSVYVMLVIQDQVVTIALHALPGRISSLAEMLCVRHARLSLTHRLLVQRRPLRACHVHNLHLQQVQGARRHLRAYVKADTTTPTLTRPLIKWTVYMFAIPGGGVK
jgi:hypothetical protein